VRSLAKPIFRILLKVTAITATARLTVTAAIFSVLTAQTATLLTALIVSHNNIYKQTVTALVLITVAL
jgi:uridine phosphorylase